MDKHVNVFLGAWEDEEDLKRDFALNDDELKGAFILLASYDCEAYEGSAFVLFEREGKIYEVNGSHCSCYGLEDMWDPEETSVDALVHRVKEGRLGWGYYDSEAFGQQVLEVLGAA